MPKQEPDHNRPVLSVTMALDWLRDQQQVVEAKRLAYEEAMHARDSAIVDALSAGIGYNRIASIVGLSKQRIWRISVQTAPEETSQ